MEIPPASVAQIQMAADGRVYEISAESSAVAADLEKIDAGLRVRFSESGKCYVVFHRHHPGCPHNGTGGPGSEYLVRSVQAQQGSTGVWTGLDQRLVDRIRFIHPHGRSGYDYAAELERSATDGIRQRKQQFAEKMGEAAEQIGHALRKDLGERYRGRAFITRKGDVS